MREIWKDIPGFEGMYQVSSRGDVRSVDRVSVVKCRHGGYTKRHDKGQPMHGTDNGNGYLMILLPKRGKRYRFYVHRLVAEMFCEKENGKEYVHHKDHNRSNNSAENLEWVSFKENIRHSNNMMRHPKPNAKIGVSGEKYIRVNRRKEKQTYTVCIRQIPLHKTFQTIDEAVKCRDKAVQML